MLNEKNERELAYVVKIEEIRPIPNYDRVEYARIGAGWWIIVKKDQFKVGSLGIYFEIDSRVPEKEPYMFLEKRHFKVKTLKMCGVVSQGLLMAPEDFGWVVDDADGSIIIPPEQYGYTNILYEGDFLTKKLGVVYADDEDNARKAPSADKYRSMQDRHKKLFKSKLGKWIMKYAWGRKIMFFFFGKKKDKKTAWPAWVKKTDEERIECCSWLFPDNKTTWIVTEKIDGTSTTFTMKNDKHKKLIVCSRNVVFDTPEKDERNYYKDSDGNVYLEMAAQYNMQKVCENAIAYWESSATPLDYITIQGETYGGTIQKRNYCDDHRLAIFNIIFGFKNGEVRRLNPIDMKIFAMKINAEDALPLETVPIVIKSYHLPATCAEVKEITGGESWIDGEMREGLVFRSDDGQQSFKSVDPNFLLKYHS